MLMPLISKPSMTGASLGSRMRWMSRAISQVVIEALLLVRLRIDDRVVKREGRLLGDRFEDDEIALRERRARRPVAEREHAHVLLSVKQRRDHDRGGAERSAAQRRQLGRVREIAQEDRLARSARRGR